MADYKPYKPDYHEITRWLKRVGRSPEQLAAQQAQNIAAARLQRMGGNAPGSFPSKITDMMGRSQAGDPNAGWIANVPPPPPSGKGLMERLDPNQQGIIEDRRPTPATFDERFGSGSFIGM